MIPALFAGGLVGLGVACGVRGLLPPRVPLATALSRLHQPYQPSARVEASLRGLRSRVGHKLFELMQEVGFDGRALERDLRVVGRPLERHMADKLLLGLVGLLLVPAMSVLLTLGGASFSPFLPLWASLIMAVLGFFAPDLIVRSQAAERRLSFRYALGSFFDLVVISLAGGGGVESALTDSAQVGEGWAYAELRRALRMTRLTRETPWTALGRLGDELGVNELTELAASVGLAGTEGARVRESLAAKTHSLRSHELAEAQAKAESASEKMSLPIVMLFMGWTVFIAYPAIHRVMGL